MTAFKPRELLAGSGLTTPHHQCFAGARQLLQILEAVTAATDARAKTLRNQGGDPESAYLEDCLPRQALSEAVQVFAAITIEGAVNLLGVLVHGDAFYQVVRPARKPLERAPLSKKLASLLATIEVEPGLRGELMALAETLSRARDAFVHPKSLEGPPETQRTPRGPSLLEARQAVDEARRFLLLLQRTHYRFRPFFELAISG